MRTAVRLLFAGSVVRRTEHGEGRRGPRTLNGRSINGEYDFRRRSLNFPLSRLGSPSVRPSASSFPVLGRTQIALRKSRQTESAAKRQRNAGSAARQTVPGERTAERESGEMWKIVLTLKCMRTGKVTAP